MGARHGIPQFSTYPVVFTWLAGWLVEVLTRAAWDIPKVNSFELFGFDVLIDQSLKPWLIEVNASPSLCCHSRDDEATKMKLIMDVVTLVDPLCFDREVLRRALQARVSPSPSNSGPSEGNLPDPEDWNKTLEVSGNG